jgi:hypothetical protein
MKSRPVYSADGHTNDIVVIGVFGETVYQDSIQALYARFLRGKIDFSRSVLTLFIMSGYASHIFSAWDASFGEHAVLPRFCYSFKC